MKSEADKDITAIFQCKRYTKPVPVRFVRELAGVKQREGVDKAYLLVSSNATAPAIEEAAQLGIEIIDGSKLFD